MIGPAERNENIRKLNELITDIRIAMLTTVDDDGTTLRSRPMATQYAEFDGDLWFFTRADSAKVDEVQEERHVNVSYAQPDKNRYVSVSGKAYLVRDQDKMEDFWNPAYKAWFPDGLDDPNLALLRVAVDQAEYWDTPAGRVVQLVGFVKAMATGEEYHPGDNEKLNLR